MVVQHLEQLPESQSQLTALGFRPHLAIPLLIPIQLAWLRKKHLPLSQTLIATSIQSSKEEWYLTSTERTCALWNTRRLMEIDHNGIDLRNRALWCVTSLLLWRNGSLFHLFSACILMWFCNVSVKRGVAANWLQEIAHGAVHAGEVLLNSTCEITSSKPAPQTVFVVPTQQCDMLIKVSRRFTHFF